MAPEHETNTVRSKPDSPMENAKALRLGPEQCDLPFWLRTVAQGTLLGTVGGHAADALTPHYLHHPGPLREALIAEFSFNALAEEKAVRALTGLIAVTPDLPTLEFYVTQLLDETRHGNAYRHHLTEIGIPRQDVDNTIRRYAEFADAVLLTPLQEFGLSALRTQDPFHSAVLVLTLLVEGVIGPMTELAARKWHPLDPAGSQVHLSASADELRHLAVGSEIIRRRVSGSPDSRDDLVGLLRRGHELWANLPMKKIQVMQEAMFQQGLEEHATKVGEYEIWEGRRLIDTTPEERVETAHRWTREITQARLRHMGLEDD
jgi:hypothetical protein